jgi:hypothetical protein
MKIMTMMVFLFIAGIASAQEPKPVLALADTSWKHTLIVSANITQISFTDWTQGGENALAYALFLEGKSAYAKDAIEWVNEYKLGFGQAKLGTQGIRKTDDMIDLGSVITYKLGAIINPYASVSLKTQFTEGVTYDAAGHTVPVSNFFDPAYIIQSAGVGYQPVPGVKTRLGVALREILTKTHTGYSDDPTTTQIEKTKVEGGMESVTEVIWTVMENVILHAKFELFAPIKHFNQTTIRSDNSLSAKVNKFLSVNVNIMLINDPPIQARTQVKEALALGISYTLLQK